MLSQVARDSFVQEQSAKRIGGKRPVVGIIGGLGPSAFAAATSIGSSYGRENPPMIPRVAAVVAPAHTQHR